jgi:acetate kinase
VEELEARGDDDARLALAVFCRRVAGAVASAAAVLGGLDAVVFTAGIGEGSAPVRAEICRRLRLLGVELDERANTEAEPDADVSTVACAVRVWVVHAREDVIAARAARALL